MRNRSFFKRKTTGQVIVFSIAFLILFIHCLSLIFCLAWGFSTSLKTQTEFDINSPLSLPGSWKFSNYKEAFLSLEVRGFSFFGLIGNSLWYAVGTPLIQITISMILAYIVIKYPSKPTKIYHTYVLVMMMINVSAGSAATYRFFSRLGILDSPLFLFGKLSKTTFAYLIFCATWRGVANDYMEAAKIDGANHFTVMFKIMIPQVMGAWGALFIMDFITWWNDYSTSMLYFPNWPTLATGLFEYEANMIMQVNMPVYFAGLMISIVPVIALFIIFQDTIMDKVSLGGIKG